MSNTPVISVHDVSFSYGNGHTILENISFNIEHGSATMLIGPNGSGKTTLLKVILGLLKPTSGRVDVLGVSPSAAISDVGYVPQRFEFDTSFPITVGEFLEFSHKDASPEDIHQGLSDLKICHLANTALGELSGGQLQRVLIVRALLGDPKILLLDEPVSGVDVGGEETFYELIGSIRAQRDVTVVMVSHEVDVVSSLATQVICVNKKMLCSGSPENVLTPETIAELYGKETTVYRHH